MKEFLVLFLALIISLNSGCKSGKTEQKPDQKARIEQLKNEVSADLTGNLLPWWSSKTVDYENGGFYGRVNSRDSVIADADKGGILNARILWTYSSAYRITKDTSYLRLATRAKDYILKYFIDKEYGGAYFSITAKGEPKNTLKQTYTNAFFIYGLSEYSRATGDKEALEAAKAIFELFEKHVLDKESNGYFEVFSRDWKRVRERMIGESSDKDEKTMNTSLHLMEAYACLYRVWPDKRMEERLRNMVNIFLDHIIDKNSYHLIVFLDRNWNSTSRIDSYGHDIESSWLLYEAAHLLKDPELLQRVKEVSVKIADAASEGLLADGGMLTEKDRETDHSRLTRSWWEQAESVVGYTNAYELTGNEDYLDKAIHAWNFIEIYMIDKENGSWFTSVTPEGIGGGDKAGNWICPYHNGRMCLEIIERVKE